MIQRARELLPAPDATSERLLTVGIGAPGEWGLVAAACWVGLWAVLARQRRPRALLLGLAVCMAVAGTQAARETLRRQQALAVVTNPATPVRGAPYGGASAVATPEAGPARRVDAPAGRAPGGRRRGPGRGRHIRLPRRGAPRHRVRVALRARDLARRPERQPGSAGGRQGHGRGGRGAPARHHGDGARAVLQHARPAEIPARAAD